MEEKSQAQLDVADKLQQMETALNQVVKGQPTAVRQLLVAVFANGHVLLEGVPGLGKTLLANSLAQVLGGEFKRIQFTPDLMPSDIVGTTIYNSQTNGFQVKQGPIFTNILLADEINRAPAKTQSALLEAMAEKNVTIDGKSYPLGDFFLCVATQNPVEMEGTYPLPEAQLDRFLVKVDLSYPSPADEAAILQAHRDGFKVNDLGAAGLVEVANPTSVVQMREVLATVQVEDKIVHYINEIIQATRNSTMIEVGASPRGGIGLLQAARVSAIFNGRNFVIPDDVASLVVAVLGHRVILDTDAELENMKASDVIGSVVKKVKVPR